jgi:diguanylate cyclase (GGDEF)-like protein/PAS domain S-box-containing protein
MAGEFKHQHEAAPHSLHSVLGDNIFRTILDLADMAVLVFNREFEVVYANHYICDRIVGIPQHVMIGTFLPRHQTLPDEELQRVIDSTMRVFDLGVPERIENWALHQDGTRRLMYWSSVPVHGPDGNVSHLLAVGMDVTEQRKEKHRLEGLAHRDVLTGLYNRAFFEHRLQEDVARASMEEIGLALFYIDLDSFKPVNDTHGHATGDTVLQEVVARLRIGLRQNDVVCRIGGDEFAVILPGVSSSKDANLIAEQMIGHLSRPYEIDGFVHNLGASIGIAFLGKDARNSHDLVRKADAAMYRAKQAGKGRYALVD